MVLFFIKINATWIVLLLSFVARYLEVSFQESSVETQEQAIKKLANTMRIYVETHFDFQRLKSIDQEEAVDNLDRAFEAKLEAFHSLYDVSRSRILTILHTEIQQP